ncbi:hypothetical protein CYMTET_36796, partial [Cymbomonas tetramitiformis]
MIRCAADRLWRALGAVQATRQEVAAALAESMVAARQAPDILGSRTHAMLEQAKQGADDIALKAREATEYAALHAAAEVVAAAREEQRPGWQRVSQEEAHAAAMRASIETAGAMAAAVHLGYDAQVMRSVQKEAECDAAIAASQEKLEAAEAEAARVAAENQ